MNVQKNISLATHTTFNIGGNARYFIEVTDLEEIQEALEYAKQNKSPFAIFGGGSNILVADDGFDGVVVKIALSALDIDLSSGEFFAEAGSSLMETIRTVCSAGLTGMEAMYGIPGTVGGAVRGNAGAFGTEIVDTLVTATALNTETNEVRTFTNPECEFDYRNSFFKKNPEWIILSASFALKTDESEECLRKADEILAIRNERQIQNIHSAGSYFMNPIVSENLQALFEEEKGTPSRGGRVPAGWLIEKAGFKGVSKNGASTGERSSNYVINTGGAVAADVQELTKEIQDKVKEEFGVELEREITQVGF